MQAQQLALEDSEEHRGAWGAEGTLVQEAWNWGPRESLTS